MFPELLVGRPANCSAAEHNLRRIAFWVIVTGMVAVATWQGCVAARTYEKETTHNTSHR